MPKIRFERSSLEAWVSKLQEKSVLISQQLGLIGT
jgi:hypothetical protein